jgi:hypothetical protein
MAAERPAAIINLSVRVRMREAGTSRLAQFTGNRLFLDALR